MTYTIRTSRFGANDINITRATATFSKYNTLIETVALDDLEIIGTGNKLLFSSNSFYELEPTDFKEFKLYVLNSIDEITCALLGITSSSSASERQSLITANRIARIKNIVFSENASVLCSLANKDTLDGITHIGSGKMITEAERDNLLYNSPVTASNISYWASRQEYTITNGERAINELINLYTFKKSDTKFANSTIVAKYVNVTNSSSNVTIGGQSKTLPSSFTITKTDYTPTEALDVATKIYVQNTLTTVDSLNNMFLNKTNTTPFSPTALYQPATKKFIDDSNYLLNIATRLNQTVQGRGYQAGSSLPSNYNEDVLLSIPASHRRSGNNIIKYKLFADYFFEGLGTLNFNDAGDAHRGFLFLSFRDTSNNPIPLTFFGVREGHINNFGSLSANNVNLASYFAGLDLGSPTDVLGGSLGVGNRRLEGHVECDIEVGEQGSLKYKSKGYVYTHSNGLVAFDVSCLGVLADRSNSSPPHQVNTIAQSIGVSVPRNTISNVPDGQSAGTFNISAKLFRNYGY